MRPVEQRVGGGFDGGAELCDRISHRLQAYGST
jgi:hypothetical protein